ncbi:acyl CoA:acetate/3-ketoacid CoA transferase [Bosea sp. (in: a-proteobacteria)]|uniref:acyl CoA:acetate/3-ketoacid CoA transferase n=1 Tax=Bosea sp. (in: a-proteobacteria) TaxID=1871050 RepID=UPI0026336193|nr:CoA-transferase [Bosea sp. (in: a-proteobacteria)]MCO5090351.1 3-oxoacid CoA-transferase [Bosea sp. (in: a-proteobacteria)]
MQVISAAEAASLIESGDSVLVSGSGGGHCVPEAILEAVEARFLEAGTPRDLCLIHAVGIGDRKLKGAARFRHPGMLKRSITGALVDSPPLIELVQKDLIESYTLPQGVIAQLAREMAAGRPGLVTKTGLHTFVDPRQLGARQSPSAREDLVELLEVDGEEWLRFKPFPIDVVLLRGTTADEDGNISMEQEAIPGEMLSSAQAGRRLGAAVVVQVKRLAKRGTLPQRSVKIPGVLVDYVVVDENQRQTYWSDYNPSYSGEMRIPLEGMRKLPFTERKIVARRAAMEIQPGAICNLGSGISTGVSAVAAEEGFLGEIVLSNEQGFIGGAPLTGPDSGAAQNYDAMVDQPYQFDFYDGGGLDIAFLSFAEVDSAGHVNVSRFGNTIVGIGGFVNISQNARKVVFSGTFTAGGLQIAVTDGQLRILQEGRSRKFVKAVEQICYNGSFARQQGRQAVFVTERAVFRVGAAGLELCEIAPGIDFERDIAAHMDFRPMVAADLKTMDARLFLSEPMGLKHDINARGSQARRPRRQLARSGLKRIAEPA